MWCGPLVVLAAVFWTQCVLLEGVDAKKERKRPKETPPQYTEAYNATLSNSEEVGESTKQIPDNQRVDPLGSWMDFVKRPVDNFPGKCRKRKRPLPGPPGPAGPPGPQGPPGFPGAEVTQEVLLQEFKEMIKEATERRAAAVDKQTSTSPSQIPMALIALEGMTSYRRIEEAFHCKLIGPVVVDKKTLMELQNFQTPPAKGAFLRGTGMDQSTGRFTAPVTGIYQLSANVHIDHSEVKRSKSQLRARDNVRVLICIESLCHRYTSLEMIVGLESNSKIFTVYVQGLLELQIGQYTSIFVDNGAGASITIQNGSDFMGMLLGV
ncbi:adipolin-like [Salvelinus namaycush]|uniref:Adipolin n=1 Tax=Salvelinus namaycush TaxID=8040 RepID=A0A8U1EUA7_SALNM|nr:adipolin-like [Salvelinus namaycush]